MDNEEDLKNFPTTPQMCKSGCGHTASELCDGQCKRCYNVTLTTQLRDSVNVGSKQLQKAQQQQDLLVPPVGDEITSANLSDTLATSDDSKRMIIDSESSSAAMMQVEPDNGAVTSCVSRDIASFTQRNMDVSGGD